MKDANRIVELLRQTPEDTLIGTLIHRTLAHKHAGEVMDMVLDLRDQDQQDNEDVRKALGPHYEEIKSLWI